MIVETIEFVVVSSIHWKTLVSMRCQGWHVEIIAGQVLLVRKYLE